MKLTGEGSHMMADAVFRRGEIALFDGDEQVTPWQPYDVQANTPVTAPRRLEQAALTLRAAGGPWFTVPADSVVDEGDTLRLPPPSTWFVSDDRAYLT